MKKYITSVAIVSSWTIVSKVTEARVPQHKDTLNFEFFSLLRIRPLSIIDFHTAAFPPMDITRSETA